MRMTKTVENLYHASDDECWDSLQMLMSNFFGVAIFVSERDNAWQCFIVIYTSPLYRNGQSKGIVL